MNVPKPGGGNLPPSSQKRVATDVMEPDNWIQIAPFGDWPHPGGTQRFTEKEAKEIVKDFNSLMNKMNRLVTEGIPFYIGFPDHPQFKDKYKDPTVYGYIVALQIRTIITADHTDGLWGKVKWNPAGAELVNNERFQGHAVNWLVKKGLTGFWYPFRIKSVGFTNEGVNIPVHRIERAS